MSERTSSSPPRSMSRRKASSACAARSSGLEHPVEVLDLEDRVGEDLRRAVVDVLGHALSLALLGLDDAQSHRRRASRRPSGQARPSTRSVDSR